MNFFRLYSKHVLHYSQHLTRYCPCIIFTLVLYIPRQVFPPPPPSFPSHTCTAKQILTPNLKSCEALHNFPMKNFRLEIQMGGHQPQRAAQERGSDKHVLASLQSCLNILYQSINQSIIARHYPYKVRVVPAMPALWRWSALIFGDESCSVSSRSDFACRYPVETPQVCRPGVRLMGENRNVGRLNGDRRKRDFFKTCNCSKNQSDPAITEGHAVPLGAVHS